MAFRAKAAKDIAQASTILEVCTDQSPGLVKDALDEAMAMGSKVERYLVNACRKADMPDEFMAMIEGEASLGSEERFLLTPFSPIVTRPYTRQADTHPSTGSQHFYQFRMPRYLTHPVQNAG